jgi:histone demethylase
VTPSKPRALPSVEEAWNLPISNEMTNRQNQPRQVGVRAGQPQQAAAGIKKEEGPGGVLPQQARPSFYLNQQQLQTLQYLQNQPGSYRSHQLKSYRYRYSLFKADFTGTCTLG